MPFLIELKTQLKDLKYDKDQRGGGSSGMPFIRFPFPENADTKTRDYYTLNATNMDFPARGGAAGSEFTGIPTSRAREIDKKLIETYLKSTPRGQMFIDKQVGLQLSNPKIQTAQAVPGFKIAEYTGALENTRVFNKGRNMLTQIQVAGTGIHLNRAGILPANPIEKFYKDIVGAEKLKSADSLKSVNRLLVLQQTKLLKDTGIISMSNNLGIPTYRDILIEYLGGPGSTYGIGSTSIKRYDHTDTAIDKKSGDGIPMSHLTMTYDKLMEQKQSTTSNGVRSDYRDFRLEVGPKNEIQSIDKELWGYNPKSRIENRFYINSRKDKINLSFPITKKNEEGSTIEDGNDDLIKFLFECVNNDDISESTFLYFRAFLGSITDNNTGTYNAFKYMGRGENFYTYQGFERSISFTFKIAIGSRDELDATYYKLNYLISQVYPDYAEKTSFMRSNLTNLTIGDYFNRIPGFIDSVNVTISNESTWEIDSGYQLPHFLDVSIGFKPIHNQLPQRSMGQISPFAAIAPSIITKTNNVVEEGKLMELENQRKQQTAQQKATFVNTLANADATREANVLSSVAAALNPNRPI